MNSADENTPRKKKSDPSDQSDGSNPPDSPPPSPDDLFSLLPKHGGYKKLRSFQAASELYWGVTVFCGCFIDKKSRTYDQMIQAARSGVRNIAEGSVDSGTSKKSELKLTNVARGSLDELRGDLEDFLRHRGLPIWDKDSPQAKAVRQRLQTVQPNWNKLRRATPEKAANTLLCLANQALYLVRRQIQRLERDFQEHGGITERLYAVRSRSRQTQAGPPPPACPKCGQPMQTRTARQGPRAGQPFWGCSGYPNCKGILPK